jgi:DNA-binding transcriptional MerR regulator
MTKSTTRADEALRQIGEVADEVGLSLRTIRYYEEVALVSPSGRSAGGFRLYTDEDVARFRLVKAFKPLKFSLDEMRDLLDLRDRVEVGEDLDADEAGRLGVYAEMAAYRSEQMRDQLQAVESLARVLARQAAAARQLTLRGARR